MRGTAIGLLALVVFLSLVTTSVEAKATKAEFAGVETLVSVGMPERIWLEGGVLHVRGVPVESITEGIELATGIEFRSTNTLISNLNLNLATGNGHRFGTFLLDATWGDLSGSFEGHFTAKLTAGTAIVKYAGQGHGEFEGMKILGSATVQDRIAHEWVILDPHGRV